MSKKPDLPTICFPDAAAFADWLEANHDTAPGLWLQFAKKNSGITSITYAQAVDVALCYGWIDGQVVSIDERYYRQRFTPRTARSKWSQINCAKVEALRAAGRMQPSGLAQVDAAKRDGRWARAYAPPSTITVPADLQARLDQHPAAAEFFATLDKRNRYAILHRIEDAKLPATRARRIEQFVTMLAEGKKLH